jgi:hypothetical protein
MNDSAYCGISSNASMGESGSLLSKPLNNMMLEGVCACWN